MYSVYSGHQSACRAARDRRAPRRQSQSAGLIILSKDAPQSRVSPFYEYVDEMPAMAYALASSCSHAAALPIEIPDTLAQETMPLQGNSLVIRLHVGHGSNLMKQQSRVEYEATYLVGIEAFSFSQV